MKELVPRIAEWIREKKPFALARVIQTWGSSPRPVGSGMIISMDGSMVGSVSGGCVEGAVIKEVADVIHGGLGKRLAYGVTDDEAWSVGLTCGGKIQAFLQAVRPVDHAIWKSVAETVAANQQGALITALTDGEQRNAFIYPDGRVSGFSFSPEVVSRAKATLTHGIHETIDVGGSSYFIHSFVWRNRMLIIGAAHITASLVRLARLHDFETIVIDPRGTFADKTVFEQPPDSILVNYPSEVLGNYPLDKQTYAVILSHDPKIDDNALQILLRSGVAYIGALGSRKSHDKRVARLKESGFTDSEISRIESPIGLDITAEGASEIALSIMASVIRTKNRIVNSDL